jgi:glycosyltransferase involved in cell wall biosynthesis
MPHLSIVTPCYNEEENVADLYEQVKAVLEALPGYTYEHIFIDNASRDRTVECLRELAARDERVRIIINARNFGHIRSPYYALLQGTGDAVILIVADLQDPPALLPEFVKKWEQGSKVVAGIKTQSEESRLMYALRSLYYGLVSRMADVQLLQHFTGFGLYDRHIIEILRTIEDPYPYLRGLISEVGYDIERIPYKQPVRKRGKTKNNFYTLYDMAILGITSHSKLPLRLAALAGFACSAMSLLVAMAYLVAKLVFWKKFELGTAPVVVGLFLLSSALLFFVGMLGEYISSIHSRVRRMPLVVERERVNFPSDRMKSLAHPCVPPPPAASSSAPQPAAGREPAPRVMSPPSPGASPEAPSR